MAEEDKTIGAGRRRRESESDVHSTGKAVRGRGESEPDVHSTGKAVRGRGESAPDVHSTGKAVRGRGERSDLHSTAKAGGRRNAPADAHATAKAPRPPKGDDGSLNLKPFEQKNAVNIAGDTSGVRAAGNRQWPASFELDGKTYVNEGILSNSSGEAVVFTVSREGRKYALKIYYYDPLHRPNHKVLEKIKQLSGSGLLVNIISHGEWVNPEGGGDPNDYELMDFCEGGSLDGVILEGDEKALGDVAVRMAAAIDFLAKHGIIHRDIKPANFFYADKEKTQIVLADFGISMECPEGSFVKIDEMRSPVYAAPEFYTNVPGEPAEVGVESDYFSLGVSLLCLWMGKARLTANESQLLRSKLTETLPMPKDMSAHTVSLLRALTRLKMSDRATFADIRRWAQGENLDIEASAGNPGFHVIFNSAKNQIAHSPAELAQLLAADPMLGKKYLYSGRVTKWLEEMGMNEVAVNVEEIVEEIYPGNQEAGLMAVAYMLDPTMDYVSPGGTRMTEAADIAAYAFRNLKEMKSEVLADDSNLKLFFRAHKLDKTLEQLSDFLTDDRYDSGDEDLNAYLAAYYLAEQFNDLPLPVEVGGKFEAAASIADLYAFIRKEDVVNDANEAVLKSPAFILWLSYRDPALAGKIRMLIDSNSDDPDSIYYNADSPYRILYELDPNADMNFNTDVNDPERVYTVQQVGQKLEKHLILIQEGKHDADMFSYLFESMEATRVADYLRSRGDAYFRFLSWNRYCMDVYDEENSQKAGPYDVVIGAYKSVAGFLGHAPCYSIGGQLISHPDELKKLPKAAIGKALGGEEREMPTDDGRPAAWLAAWLTLFYQENPGLDLSRKFTYEKATAEYIEFICTLAPDNYYARRYNRAIRQIDKASARLGRSDARVKLKRTFFLLFAGVPALLTLVLSWFFAAPAGNPLSGHFMAAFAICFVAIAILAGVMYETFIGAVIPGVIGGLACAGLAYAGYSWSATALYIIVGAILLIGSAMAIYYLFRRETVDTGGAVISGKMFEYRQLDALYFTFRDDSDDIENAMTLYSEAQRSYDETTRANISFVGWLWACPVWMIALIWFFATPGISGRYSWAADEIEIENTAASAWALGTWEFKLAAGTRIVCKVDSIADDKYLTGTMQIGSQAPVAAKGVVYAGNDSLPASFSFQSLSGNYQKQNLNVEYDTKGKSVTGHYFDRKGIRNGVTFLATPLAGVSLPAPAPASSGKQKKQSASRAQPVAGPQSEAPATAPATVPEAKEEAQPEQQTRPAVKILGDDTLY